MILTLSEKHFLLRKIKKKYLFPHYFQVLVFILIVKGIDNGLQLRNGHDVLYCLDEFQQIPLEHFWLFFVRVAASVI